MLPFCSPNFLFLLFSLREKLKSIAQATYTHSRNLAYFVFTYKGLMALQSRLQGKKIPFHSFFAACIGGWLVFGENNPINSQVNVSAERLVDRKTNRWVGCVPGSGWYRLAHFSLCSIAFIVQLIVQSSLFDCAQTLEVVVCPHGDVCSLRAKHPGEPPELHLHLGNPKLWGYPTHPLPCGNCAQSACSQS